jgi:hypothetical protein
MRHAMHDVENNLGFQIAIFFARIPVVETRLRLVLRKAHSWYERPLHPQGLKPRR